MSQKGQTWLFQWHTIDFLGGGAVLTGTAIPEQKQQLHH